MLELYQSEECPSCQQAREAMTERGLSYVIHNPRRGQGMDKAVLNAQRYRALRLLHEEDRLPVLVDSDLDAMLAGDEAIVAHLADHYS